MDECQCPCWCRTHGIPEPSICTFRRGVRAINILINHKVIPVLDFMFWVKREKISKFRMRYGLVSHTKIHQSRLDVTV
ncbi:TPA: DUF6387 family protein [Raoultella planticola]